MKMKPINLILMLNTTFILMKKNPKFKVGDHVKISEYKKILAKRFVRN